MAEPVFKSTLTDEEIDANFSKVNFFTGIMAGLEEALAYEKGRPRRRPLPGRAASPISILRQSAGRLA